jgi:hypothetical protein
MKFSAARFLPGQDVTTVWTTFVRCWCAQYIGHPECLLTDQGSVFVSKDFHEKCNHADISLSHTGTASHNSLGLNEKMHAVLRNVYLKVSEDDPKVPPDDRLLAAVSALNFLPGPDGLVPVLLIFGVLPRIPELAEAPRLDQKRHFAAMASARAENARLVARRRVETGLHRQVPPAADFLDKITPGSQVYCYRERLRHWTRPHTVADVNRESVHVHLGERTGPRAFNIAQLKPALAPPHVHFERSTCAAREGTYVYWTEVLSPGDPRASLFEQAKKDEILDLIRRGTFDVVLNEEAIANADGPLNVLPCNSVLAIKHRDNGEDVLKSRSVIGSHCWLLHC